MTENVQPVKAGFSADNQSESVSSSTPSFSDENPVDQCWALAVADVCRDANQHIVAAYIEPLELDVDQSTAETVVVTGPSRLICNYVNSRFTKLLEERLAFYSQISSIQLSVVPLDRNGSQSRTNPEVQPSHEPPQKVSHTPYVVKRVRKQEDIEPKRSNENSTHENDLGGSDVYNNINPRYTFSDFVVGNSNQFCHAAAMRVAEKPGESYNPLFIYGGVGLGKTHMLHSIGNVVLQKNPNARVLYMSSETFTNELILALRHAKMEEFKKRLRTIEVLLIDDIQFISGKERTQEEFFHTFNALYSAKRQIVITSDKIPTDIPGIEERLQTRFSWGLTADLQAPDFETRVAILKQKAILEEFHLPHEVSHLIAERISSNVRELEGALTRLHAMSSIQNVPISLEMAKSALKPLLQPKMVNVTVDDIKKAVATHFSIKVSEIISKRRTKNLSFPRHIAMYLCRKHTTASYPEIGEHFGGRDHSSVIHAASVVTSKLSTDETVKELIEEIEKAILS